MKNIHILPTDKPSRLYEFGGNLILTKTPETAFRNKNIYITSSDEEIKEGDWFLSLGVVFKCSALPLSDTLAKKIILTTDKDLIKDGIQAIPDEFLEWFVKNPSCEEVDVEIKYNCKEIGNCIFDSHKIIIPKEEPKQETLEEAAEKYSKNELSKLGFLNGVKWQQEQDKKLYSEEDMQKAFNSGWENNQYPLSCPRFEEWIKQFKKK